MRRTFLKAGAACGVQLMLGTAHAQQASARPMEWVVGFAAGGGSDAVRQEITQAITAVLDISASRVYITKMSA